MLLEHHAKLYVRDARGETPLWVAASDGQAKVVRVLIDAGADVNATDERNRGPLDVAMERKHMELAEMLKKAGAKTHVVRPASSRATTTRASSAVTRTNR